MQLSQKNGDQLAYMSVASPAAKLHLGEALSNFKMYWHGAMQRVLTGREKDREPSTPARSGQLNGLWNQLKL